jgi:hypothetical protein
MQQGLERLLHGFRGQMLQRQDLGRQWLQHASPWVTRSPVPGVRGPEQGQGGRADGSSEVRHTGIVTEDDLTSRQQSSQLW